jgi:hypothetical protein
LALSISFIADDEFLVKFHGGLERKLAIDKQLVYVRHHPSYYIEFELQCFGRYYQILLCISDAYPLLQELLSKDNQLAKKGRKKKSAGQIQ